MRSHIAALCLLMACLVGLASCQEERSDDSLSVAVLLAPSGRGDRSYNDMALAGVSSVADADAIQVRDILPAQSADYESVLRDLIEAGTDLIIGVGFTYTDAFKSVAPESPQSNFLLIDGDAGDLENVRSVEFRPEEGSFLVGAVAGHETESLRVGFVGGMDIPILQRFECGYREGVNYMAGQRGVEVTTVVRYLGSTPAAFGDPARGRDTAMLMYADGVDIIFHAAGKSGNGVIRAAVESGKFVIGVDADQSYLAPEHVLTSMRKRIDSVVKLAIEQRIAGTFEGGKLSLGVSDGGLDWVVNPGDTEHISPALKEKISSLAEVVDSGAVSECANTGD